MLQKMYLQIGRDEFDVNSYHPTKLAMTELYLGKYFRALAQLKGYINKSENQNEREFVARGRSAFMDAQFLDWTPSLINPRSEVAL